MLVLNEPLSMTVPSTVIRPQNPSNIGYPHTLPIEVALRVAPIKDICTAYGLSKADWDTLRFDPVFVADVSRVSRALQTEGMSFKLKAQLQAEELLKQSWKLIHDQTGDVPPTVKADLIKATWRISGLDESKNKANTAEVTAALQININMG